MTSEPIEKTDVIALLSDLIRAESVNPPGNESRPATLLATWLRERGVEAELRPMGDNRANLVARVRGDGHAPALVFCGHFDTVPVGDAPWSHPPFAAEIEGDRLYGRGASDMKGGIAAMAAALVALHHRASALRRDVLFLGTVGEEVDSRGAARLVEEGYFDGVGAMVIAEPTSLDLGIAHKGAFWLRVTVPGRAAHGSAPHLGSNAILNAYEFVQALLAQGFDVAPHPLLGMPTISPNVIAAGIGSNIVPDRCRVTLDIRSVPGLAHASVLETIRALLNEVTAARGLPEGEIEVLLDRAPLDTPQDAEIVRIAARAVESVTGAPPAIKGMTYFTDASVIVPVTGTPTIIYGPGDLDQAHQTNESVSVTNVVRAAQVYEAIALAADD